MIKRKSRTIDHNTIIWYVLAIPRNMSTPSSSTVQGTSDIPPLEELLVSIDVAPRAEKLKLTHTMNALHERAKLDGLADSEPYLKLAILVASRRRHHLKAMASGTGAGEWCVLRAADYAAVCGPHPRAAGTYKLCCLSCPNTGLGATCA